VDGVAVGVGICSDEAFDAPAFNAAGDERS
jgi:hypothetical protein